MVKGAVFLVRLEVDFDSLQKETGLPMDEIVEAWNSNQLVNLLAECSISVGKLIQLSGGLSIDCPYGYSE